MQLLRVYASDPASVKVADLALRLHHRSWRVQLRPLHQLPAPLAVRLAPMRLEREELRQALTLAEWSLEQLASGHWQPDAGLENGLRADVDALTCRLRALTQTLAALEKGSLAC